MNNRGDAVIGLFVCLFASVFVSAQTAKVPVRSPAGSSHLQVVSDLKQRLAKFRQVEMPFQSAGLTANENKMVLKLVEASGYIEDIFWRQVDPEGLELYQSLEGSKNPPDIELRRYLWINGSRFDLIDKNRPFVGDSPMSPGGGFYPEGLTREQVEQYVKEHPEKRAEIYNPTTIVRWRGGELVGLPYHIAFRSFLEPAAKDLREAAELSADPAFANFLRMRADALLTDDYFNSDIAWLELKHPDIDLIFAPYETYSDGLLGVKATYGAAVLIRDRAESRRLAMFQRYVPEIQDSLPVAEGDRPSKRGLETPMEVVDSPFRAGDLAHGYQAVADNLPNDPRIHEQKGSKKIFFKNFMDARVNDVILPLARQVMPAKQSAEVSAEAYLIGTVMHEISHGLGPAFAHNAAGDQISIREAIGPTYSGLEEAKADVVGMFALRWLVDRGVLPKEQLHSYYASYVADFFRAARFGGAEAHGQAEMMEFNYYIEHGGIRRLPSGKYALNFQVLPGQIDALAKELLQMEATGDRDRAKKWFDKYGVVAPGLKQSLAEAHGVPIDIDPVFSFPRKLE